MTESKTWSSYAKSYAYDELRGFYTKQEEFSKALEWAIKAYNTRKSERFSVNLASAYNNLALLAVKQKNYSEAEQHFLNSYKYNGNDFTTTKNVGFFYYNIKEYYKALTYYLKALEIEPDNVMALRNTAMLYYILEKFTEAKKFLNEAIDLNTDENYRRELLIFEKAIEEKLKEKKD